MKPPGTLRWARGIVCVGLALMLAAACGRSQIDLASSDSGVGEGGNEGGDGAPGDAARDADGASPDAMMGGDSSGADTGTTADSGADAGDSAMGMDGALDVIVVDSAMGTDSSGMDSGTDASDGEAPLVCGMSLCDPTSQQCCVSVFPPGTSCTPAGNCSGVTLSCTGSSGCTGGDVCCFSFGGGAPSSSCQPWCSGGVGPGIQLCSGIQDCAVGQFCAQTPFGVGVCL